MKEKLFTCFCMLMCFSAWVFSQQATNISFNPIPKDSEGNPVHWTASDRYESVSVNGVEIPVIDGKNPAGDKDRLDYDFTTFSATTGKATIRIKTKNRINAIKISPVKLNIPVSYIDDYTCEFDVPDPTDDEPFYLIVSINGNRLAIARDLEETDVPETGAAGVFNIKDYLTDIDATLQENAVEVAQRIQQAMDDASQYGTPDKKGTVYVPAGLYYMGNLWLKSNTELYLEKGSVIRFTDNKEDYTDDFIKTSLWSDDPVGRHGTWWICTEEGAENIKIYGRGTLDGNGYYLQKRANRDRLFCNNLLMIMQAQNVEVDGIVLFQGAFWGTIVARSNDITFRNIKFFQSMDGNENDGIDVCEAQNVLVDRCIGISLDDPFSTKTWAGTGMMINWFGEPRILDNVTFNHCISLTYCGAFKCGHGVMQKQQNIYVKNSVVVGAGRAIGIEPQYGHPEGLLSGYENIVFENIDIEEYGGEGWLKLLAPSPDVAYPPIKNITLKDIKIRYTGTSGSLKGYDENNMVDGVTFENITLYDNVEPVTNLTELNILNTGFYKNVNFVEPREERIPVYRLQAEYANTLKDISVEPTDDEEGIGSHLYSLNNTDFLVYRNVDFGSKTSQIKLRMRVDKAFTIEFWVDCTLNGSSYQGGTHVLSTSILETSDWEDIDISFEDTDLNGVHDLFIVFKADNYDAVGNFNWFEIYREFAELESLTLEEKDFTLNVGQSRQLTAILTPANAYDNEIVWSIANESGEGIIEVTEGGIVRALKEGEATVKVESVSKPELSATVNILVTELGWTDVKRIEPNEVDILYGKDYSGNAGISLKDNQLQGLWQGNYAIFKDVNFGEYTSQISIHYIVPRQSKVEFWIDREISENGTPTGGTCIGLGIIQAGTMDWYTYETFDIPVGFVSGVHDLSLEFSAYGATATNQQFGTVLWMELTRHFVAEAESVTANPSELILFVGGKQKVELEVTPAEAAYQDFIWTIEEESGEDVIEIQEGIIKALTEGTAVVKVANENNPDVFVTINVTVTQYENTDVIRVWAKDADIVCDTYHFGDQTPISIGNIADPEDENGQGFVATWHENFAVFRDVDFGMQTISASVRKGYPRGSKMELWIDRLIDMTNKIATGGTLIGSVEFPEASTDWNRWQTFEMDIEDASGIHDLCVVFLAGGGSATNQNYGALNWIEFTRALPTVGIENIEVSKNVVTVYPNPVSSALTIQSHTDIQTITITDISGRVVYTAHIENAAKYIVDTEGWVNGLYLVQVKTVFGISTYKIIKK